MQNNFSEVPWKRHLKMSSLSSVEISALGWAGNSGLWDDLPYTPAPIVSALAATLLLHSSSVSDVWFLSRLDFGWPSRFRIENDVEWCSSLLLLSDFHRVQGTPAGAWSSALCDVYKHCYLLWEASLWSWFSWKTRVKGLERSKPILPIGGHFCPCGRHSTSQQRHQQWSPWEPWVGMGIQSLLYLLWGDVMCLMLISTVPAEISTYTYAAKWLHRDCSLGVWAVIL